MTTLILFALALLADVLTTRLAVSAGAHETNQAFGRFAQSPAFIIAHAIALGVGFPLVHTGAQAIVWGASGMLGLVSLWNLVVWRRRKHIST
jgi:hypothetical protein